MRTTCRRIAAGAMVFAGLGVAEGADAHLALVGGFRPVAWERSARALWTSPGMVGIASPASAMAEVILDEESFAFLEDPGAPAEGDYPTDIQGLSVATATDRLGYGFQYHFGDAAGVPEWTLAVGNRVPLGNSAHVGLTAEWRGGEGNGLDGTVGLLVPVGRKLRLAAVGHDVLEHDLNGNDVSRHWQLGAALPISSIRGAFTFDSVLREQSDAVHWIGLTLEQLRRAHLSVARSSDGDWNVTLDAVFPSHRIGIGAVDREAAGTNGPDRAFVAAEWKSAARSR